MFSKDNIIVEKFIFPHADMTDHAKQKQDLYLLCKNIICELSISTLETIHIKGQDIFSNEAGNAVFNFNKNKSCIELNRKPYVNFNNDSNIELKTEALATIYHEMYHIQDCENCASALSIIPPKSDTDLYYIGFHYWSEFYAYYMTRNIYISDYAYKTLDKVCVQVKNNPIDNSKQLFYTVSQVAAYVYNNSSPNSHCLANNRYFKKLILVFEHILINYPQSICRDNFIILGEVYYELFTSLQ